MGKRKKGPEPKDWAIEDVRVILPLGRGMVCTKGVESESGDIALGVWLVDHGCEPGKLPKDWKPPVGVAPLVLFVPDNGPDGVMGCHEIARAILGLGSAVCRKAKAAAGLAAKEGE